MKILFAARENLSSMHKKLGNVLNLEIDVSCWHSTVL